MRDPSAKSSDRMISNSDDPYLADILTDPGEPQALFVGNVNPENIKNIWVSKDPKIASRFVDFERISLKDFKKTYGEQPAEKKLFKPRDMPSLEEFSTAIAKNHRRLTPNDVIKIMKDMDPRELDSFFDEYLWNDTQKQRIKSQMSK